MAQKVSRSKENRKPNIASSSEEDEEDTPKASAKSKQPVFENPSEERGNRLLNNNTTLLVGEKCNDPKTGSSKTTLATGCSWLQDLCDARLDTPMNPSSEGSGHPHCASFDEIEFKELFGLEYGFYKTEKPGIVGFLRLQPLQEKPKTRCGNFTLTFLMLVGEVRAAVGEQRVIRRPGDVFIVKSGKEFSITNLGETLAVLQVFKTTSGRHNGSP